MNWIKHDGYQDLKQGTIAITSEKEIVLVGKINESQGINDEFCEKIIYYTEDYIQELENIIEIAKLDFIKSNLKI